MADTKISALAAASAAASANELAINEAGTTKKLTVAKILTYLQTVGMPRVTSLASPHTVSSATATEVAIQQTLEAGTYYFKFCLMVRSAATGIGPQLGVNFTGTATVKNFIMWWADNTSAVTAEVHTMDAVGIKTAGFISGMAHNAYTTTAPNMGTTVGVSATATNIPCFIEGIVIVTVSGDLELWEGSEDTTQVTVEAGSSLVVIRTA